MNVLVELKIPFLFAQGLAEPGMIEAIREAVTESEGRGMLAAWVRQYGKYVIFIVLIQSRYSCPQSQGKSEREM